MKNPATTNIPQVNADLKARRKQLGETRSGQREDISMMNNKHQVELVKMKQRHDEECKMLDDDYLDRADNLRKDVELLENEMESMNAPGQLASLALDSSLCIPCSPAPGPLLSELVAFTYCQDELSQLPGVRASVLQLQEGVQAPNQDLPGRADGLPVLPCLFPSALRETCCVAPVSLLESSPAQTVAVVCRDRPAGTRSGQLDRKNQSDSWAV